MKSVARKMTISDEALKQYLGCVREKYAHAGRAAPTKLGKHSPQLTVGDIGTDLTGVLRGDRLGGG
jgi:hypothetical protein